MLKPCNRDRTVFTYIILAANDQTQLAVRSMYWFESERSLKTDEPAQCTCVHSRDLLCVWFDHVCIDGIPNSHVLNFLMQPTPELAQHSEHPLPISVLKWLFFQHYPDPEQEE